MITPLPSPMASSEPTVLPEAFGQIGLTVAVAVGEEPLQQVGIDPAVEGRVLHGLLYFDHDDGWLHRLGDLSIDAAEVARGLQLLARRVDFLCGAGELHVLHEASSPEPCDGRRPLSTTTARVLRIRFIGETPI